MTAHLVSAERVSKTYGTRTLLDSVTIGLSTGDVVGVVGRNGDGKSTLLGILTGQIEPDSGLVRHSAGPSIGHLHQRADHHPGQTVRDLIVGGRPDHVWAADPVARPMVRGLLRDIDLDVELDTLSGGEARRAELVALMLGNHDLLVLDEPTNHLDVEAVDWLAAHLNSLQRRGTAMLVVSHDRWFLDAICSRIWEVHDARVDPYDGGYAAYVLARAERQRQAAASEARRQNLVRKELAWLRRGPPARTSKPKFRIDAANALIDDVPEPRDKLALAQLASARLGKDVIDLHSVGLALGGRTLLDHVTWSLPPGARIGLVGVNGSGKSSLLKVMAKELSPDSGTVKHGLTLRLAHLSQAVAELDPGDRVLESVRRLAERTTLATGRETSASTLLEDFGFTGDRLVTRIGDLSGGERRRLQLLRLLLGQPNVLLLDEPTNDLDIDTLTVIEDHLDSWPGTMVVVTHDRFFLERVCDVTYALLGDGSCVLLPGGVEEYLARRREAEPPEAAPAAGSGGGTASSQQLRQARKDLARIEGQLGKLDDQLARLHQQMADAASDHEKLIALQGDLDQLQARRDELENAWLAAAELAE
ncbi:ABC-F family ATP-binding cassette domain-containing protein [Naumannella huperziae]